MGQQRGVELGILRAELEAEERAAAAGGGDGDGQSKVELAVLRAELEDERAAVQSLRKELMQQESRITASWCQLAYWKGAAAEQGVQLKVMQAEAAAMESRPGHCANADWGAAVASDCQVGLAVLGKEIGHLELVLKAETAMRDFMRQRPFGPFRALGRVPVEAGDVFTIDRDRRGALDRAGHGEGGGLLHAAAVAHRHQMGYEGGGGHTAHVWQTERARRACGDGMVLPIISQPVGSVLGRRQSQSLP